MNEYGRPAGVTLVGVLIVIIGILSVIAGIVGIFNAEMRLTVGFWWLIGDVILGIIYLAVAKGIFNGNNFSRLLVGAITVIDLLIGIFELIFVSDYRLQGLLSIIFSLVILGLLFSRRATLYFLGR